MFFFFHAVILPLTPDLLFYRLVIISPDHPLGNTQIVLNPIFSWEGLLLSLKKSQAGNDKDIQVEHKSDETEMIMLSILESFEHLRPPLNSIIGFSRVILNGIDGPITTAQEEDLNSIYASGQYLLYLLNNLRDIMLIGTGRLKLSKFEKIDLSSLAEQVIDSFTSNLNPKNIEIVLETVQSIPDMWGDRARLRQVFFILLDNAVKFTEEGKISVKLQLREEDIFVSIQDTGIGIENRYFDSIFKPFFRVNQQSGFGLGLAIAKHIIKLHDGDIWLESIPGSGTVFHFTVTYAHEYVVPTFERETR